MNESFTALLNALEGLRYVESIGKSGGRELPQTDDGDVDLFLFCQEIPGRKDRLEALNSTGAEACDIKISDCESRFWGTCDFVGIGGMDVCLMYFTTTKMTAEIDAVLAGKRLDKEDNYFYPTGRCATILTMNVYLDRRGYIAGLKERLSEYPANLSMKLAGHHLAQLDDAEDLERAVSRGDVLFYHFALDISIDHFLQALFAANRRFFPSRKRSIQSIDGFSHQPAECAERLLRVIELAGKPETLPQSYAIWAGLCGELAEMVPGGSK